MGIKLRIASVTVGNFRGVAKASFGLSDLTALIGPNGSGKTTLLLAVERFFSRERGRMTRGDFNNEERPITVTLALSPKEGPDRVVTCEWRYDKEKKSVQTPKYTSGGREIKRIDRILSNIEVVYVPAEHETDADGEDKRNTPLERMIDGALRKKASLEADREALQKKFEAEYGRRLEEIEDLINGKLSGDGGIGYAPNTRVSLKFTEPEVKMGTRLSVSDLDSERAVSHKYAGHGTKRAFYMSVLEAISEMPAKGGEGTPGRPDSLTIIAIDEPELHQHPQRQKAILKALCALSRRGPRQVVYSTHSPHFVMLKAPMSVRRVVREVGGTRIHDGRGIGKAQVRGAVISAMEEAVFARGVILVEGYTDAVVLGAVLRGTTHRVNGKDQSVMETLIKAEVAIAECGGKPNVTRFCDVLDSLDIRKFVVWDGDSHHKGKQKKAETRERNAGIIRALGLDPGFLGRVEAARGGDCVVGDACACFGFDGATYFAKCFGMRHRDELEGAIAGGRDLDADLCLDALEKTGFFVEVVPAILGRFAK